MNTHPLPPLKDAPDPRYLVIGSALRHARLQARKSLQEASDALEPSPGRSRGPVRGRTISQLSRVETGKCPPWADVVEKLLHHYAYPPDLANELIAMAANWAQSTPNTLHDPAPGWNVRLGIVEGAATHLRTFASLYVPPAVRTPDYGNALRDAELTLDGEEERPRARSLRADALTMILEWSVLERAVGGQAVMAGQLKHLRALTTAGRLRLRILPNRHGVYGPSCAVMTQMVVHDQCLFVAEGGWAIYMTGPGAGGNCAARLDALGNAACSEPESLDLLDTAITRFERQAVRAGGCYVNAIVPESVFAAQGDLLDVLTAATLTPPRADESPGSDALTVEVAYLPAADPSQVVDARDPASVHRFKQDLHGLGISVGVRHVATPDSPHIEIVVPPARDAAALAEHIVSRLPSHAAAACRLRRALAGAGIASRVSVARPRPPKERCEECRIRTGDSPAWCTSCLPREVSPGHLHPKDAVLLLGGLQAPDWLTDIDLDDMADLHRIADALQTVLRQITEEDVTVVPHPQCGVCEARAIEIEGTLSGGGADRLTAAILKRPTHDASKKSRSAAPRLINLLPTAVDSAGPDVEMPLSTRDLERRAAAAAELLRPLRTVESVLAACHMSNRRDTAAITLLVDRLLLSGFVVDRSSPDSVDRLKTVLAHEGIDAKATIRTVQGSPHAVEVALRTVADAVALRHFIVQNLPLDCAAAWRLTVALNLLGIDARASVNAIGALSIMRLSPQEALRLHEVALRRVDPTARALDLDEFRDVVLLAAMLMNTLSDLLDRQIAVSALADEGETAYYPDIEIETSFEIFEGDRLAAALTRAHDSFPDDVEGTYS